MSRHYNGYDSFTIKTRVALFMMVVLPYLLMAYLYLNQELSVAESIVFVIPLILFSILAGFSLIRRSADQLSRLEDETARAADVPGGRAVAMSGDAEMTDIAAHFNTVVGNLQSLDGAFKDQSIQLMKYAQDLVDAFKSARAERELRTKLGRYVGAHVVDRLLESEQTLFDESAAKTVTVLFADIRSFTTLSEDLSAREVVALLNTFFERMVAVVFAHQGILDKFVGDQVMAVFGVLPGQCDPAVSAVHAAVAMQRETARLMQDRRNAGEKEFAVGIGINTGPVILGNIGCDNRMDFTVIGDAVNVAARLQSLAKGGQVIIGEATRQRLDDTIRVAPCGALRLRNKTRPVNCFRVTGLAAGNSRTADAAAIEPERDGSQVPTKKRAQR